MVIPTFLAIFAVLENEHATRSKFAYFLNDGAGRWRITKTKEQTEGRWINFEITVRSQKRSNFRAEGKLTMAYAIVDQLDPHRVPRDNQPFLS